MSIDRGHGIATSSVLADSYDLDALIADTEAAKVAAEAAQAAAETAETNAETAETNAETAETNASTSATSASSSATTATTQATTATTQATNASTSATNAATSETNAATSATNASTSETNVATSFDTFDDRFLGTKTSDPTLDNDGDALLEGAMYYNSTANDIRFYNGTSWDAPATDAASSATSASSSASSASTSATTATTQASNASTSATNAATSETNAATSATTATTQASNASTSATNASTSETNASTSETNAASSATNSASSATAAAASATAAAASADSFDDTYLGAKASDPTLDNDGDALTEGDMYFNSGTDRMRVYSGSAWADVALDSATLVSKSSGTGSAYIPVGTTAQRDGTPATGYFRFNSTDSSTEIYDGSAWSPVGGGNSTDKGLYEHANTISANYTITSGNNALTAGPITINTGVSVTVPTGSTWVVA